MLDIEIATQSEGEVRATVSADWLPDPIVRETTLSVARTTTLRIPLPDAGGRDPAKFKVVLDWVDDPSPQSQTEFVVIRDTQSPRVRFRAYDRLYEPGAPIRVVRARDVTAVVEDAGGFDEAGKVHQVEVGRDEKLYRVSFTRKRLDTPRGVWRAVVSARDHAGNTAPELPQLLEVVNPEFEIREPAPGQATGSRALHVALTAPARR